MKTLTQAQIDDIREKMRLIGLTQQALADQTGYTISMVNKILKGKRGCPIGFANTLSVIMDGEVSAIELLGIKERVGR
jgi:transcriptional regulator with XRE-family HTH domain